MTITYHMEQYKYPSDPVADPAAIVKGEKYRFTLLTDGLVRYEWAPDGQFEDRPSIFALNRRQPVPKYEVVETDDELQIITKRFHLVYAKSLNCFSPNSLTVQVRGAIALWGTIWRYGHVADYTGNLGGTARTLDEANGAIPLEDGVLSRRGYAHIDDSTSMLLRPDGWVEPRRPGPGRDDGYVFAYGLDYRAAMKTFFSVSGPQPSLPRWALGNWWSRFYAYTADEYTELMENFRQEGIPMSVAVIDMDWHLFRSPVVQKSGSTGWTGYTWEKKLFPDPPKFLEKLHNDFKLKVTLNDHPADGVYSYEDSYEDMGKALDIDTSQGHPIQFDPTSPAFFKAFLQILHRRLEKEGVDFWWIDWQQGPFSRIPGIDPLWLLNHFHYIDNKLFPPPYSPSAASNPLIFSRYAGPGSHRYPLGFSGDSVTTWASLDFQAYFTLTASNIGYGWWSHDIGGHMLGSRDDELVTRWIQLGCMSPILRLHSTDSPWMGKEPWGYGPEARSAITTWLRFRHRLLPYLASVNFAMGQEGETQSWPLVQPMYWDYPTHDAAYASKNQFFFGSSNLIVAPITEPANPKTKLAKVKAWIPPAAETEEEDHDSPAQWIDIFTGSIYSPNKEIVLYRPLSQYPILAKQGTIITLDGSETPVNGCSNPSTFELLVIVGRDARFDILEEEINDQEHNNLTTDPSEAGILRTIPIRWTQSSGTLTIGPTSTTSTTSPPSSSSTRSFTLRFPTHTTTPPSSITATHASTPLPIHPTITKSTSTISPSVPHPLFTCDNTLITLPAVPFPLTSPITVVLKPDAGSVELTPPSPLPSIRRYLHSSQLSFGLKDRIWNIVSEEKDGGAKKLGRLTGVDVDEVDPLEKRKGAGDGGGGKGAREMVECAWGDVMGPVVEVLSAPE